jgi:predicted aspartyl protease
LAKANQPVPQPIRIRGLIDTGASCSAIDPAVSQALGLVSTGTVDICTPSTSAANHACDQYDVLIAIYMDPPDVHIASVTIPVISAPLAHMGIQALIGRDILDQALLIYNGKSQQITLAF